MPSGNKDIAEYGKNTQFPHNDPTKGGRKPSIKRELEKLLETEGVMIFPQEDIIQHNEDGSVTVKVPTSMQMALKLQDWANGNHGGNSIKAIQMIMEQIDGKPKNTHEVTGDLSVTWIEEKTYE